MAKAKAAVIDETPPIETAHGELECETLPAVVPDEAHPHKGSQALDDLRREALGLPVEQMQPALDEYSRRRAAFRSWILSQLKEGVHYGFPPGCAPQIKVIDGVPHMGIWKRGKDGAKGSWDWIPPSQWQVKPSLYKAGAELVCDLMSVKPIPKPDLDGWKMLGEPKGTFVIRCVLVSRSTGDELGEGLGAFKVGEKGMNENAALKMAEKRAKTDAVLNTYGLSDLFTQDIEDDDGLGKEPSSPPDPNSDAPTAQPRAQRVNKILIGELIGKWRTSRGFDPHDASDIALEEFAHFAHVACDDDSWNPSKVDQWTRDRLDACHRKLDDANDEIPF